MDAYSSLVGLQALCPREELDSMALVVRRSNGFVARKHDGSLGTVSIQDCHCSGLACNVAVVALVFAEAADTFARLDSHMVADSTSDGHVQLEEDIGSCCYFAVCRFELAEPYDLLRLAGSAFGIACY